MCSPTCLHLALTCRVVDPKEHIRQLVAASLSAALQQHSADTVVAALARALQANRAPKVKCAVMDCFAAAARGSEQQPPLLRQLAGTGAGLAGLLRSMLQLAADKNPDIRRAAAEAVAAAYHGGEAQAVMAAVHALPPADALAVQRAVGPAIQRGATAAAKEAPLAAPRPGSRAVDSSAQHSRRQSSEGLKQLGSQGQPHRRAESSGSLTARSRHRSQAASPPKAPAVAPTAAVAAAPVQAAAPPQLTPEPPSPFMWRSQSASPLPAEQQPAGSAAVAAAPADSVAAECPAHVAALPAPAAASAAPQQTALASSQLAPFDDVMAAQLARVLAQLEAGSTSEGLQALSRLAHLLPAAAWPPCFEQASGGAAARRHARARLPCPISRLQCLLS